MSLKSGPLAEAELNEVFLWVKDFEKMRSFYHETLGLAIVYENPRFAELRTKGASIALHAGRKDVRGTDHWFMHFRVSDLDRVVSALKRRGVTCGPVREESFGRVTSFTDPEGNEIGLEEPPG